MSNNSLEFEARVGEDAATRGEDNDEFAHTDDAWG